MAIVLLVAVPGCAAVRSGPSLDTRPSGKPILLLPVLPSDVRLSLTFIQDSDPKRMAVGQTLYEDRSRIAQRTNEILDDLSSSGALRGPTHSSTTCPPESLQELNMYLEEPGPLQESWKAVHLLRLSRELGAQRIVRTRVHLELLEESLEELVSPNPEQWNGVVRVSATLIDLDEQVLLAAGTGEEEVWGLVGIVGSGGPGGAIVFPVAFGRALGEALESASRRALSLALGAEDAG